LGGAGTLVGPLIGGAVLILMADVLSSVMKNWLIIFGLLYILVVMFSPKGLWGFLLKLTSRWRL
jgi:branched-chain amino acid transport system permease protein